MEGRPNHRNKAAAYSGPRALHYCQVMLDSDYASILC